MKDGSPLPPAGHPRLVTSHELGRVTLVIDDVTEADAGRYTCTMNNAAGTATSTADLVVKSEWSSGRPDTVIALSKVEG